MGAMLLYFGGSFMEEISIIKFAFIISSTFHRRLTMWRQALYFRGSVTTVTVQNVQRHLRLTGWWAVRQGKRSMLTLTTGQRVQISLRFNMKVLGNTNTKKKKSSFMSYHKERNIKQLHLQQLQKHQSLCINPLALNDVYISHIEQLTSRRYILNIY